VLVVENDKIKSLPDFVAAKPPGGIVTAAAENDAAKAAAKSRDLAKARRKHTFEIVRINRLVNVNSIGCKVNAGISPEQRSERAGAQKTISYQLNASFIAEAK
jgi:hypothetical protein